MTLFRKQPDPLDDDMVIDLLGKLIEAKSWPAVRALLERNPVLVSERGPRTAKAFADWCLERDRYLMGRTVIRLGRLLERARAVGVASAIDEGQRRSPGPDPTSDRRMLELMTKLLYEGDIGAKVRFLDRNPAVYGEAGREVLEELIAVSADAGDAEGTNHMILHSSLLGRCAEVGVARTFAELRHAMAP